MDQQQTKRRRRLPQFSLRTMLIVMTLAGVFVGPLIYEYRLARVLQRQAAGVFEQHGTTTGRYRTDFSAQLARRVPLTTFMGQHILGAHFGRADLPVDLAPLQNISTLVRFDVHNRPILVSDDAFRHPGIKAVGFTYTEASVSDGDLIKYSVFDRLPNLNRVQFVGPPSPAVMDRICGIAELRHLSIDFSQNAQPLPAGYGDALRNLTLLETLRLTNVPKELDLSFLKELRHLEEVSIMRDNGTSPNMTRTDDEALKLACADISQMEHLQEVAIAGCPFPDDDLRRLLKHSPLEGLRVSKFEHGAKSLRMLNDCPTLKLLSVFDHFDDDSQVVLQEIGRLERIETMHLQLRADARFAKQPFERMSNLRTLVVKYGADSHPYVQFFPR